MQQEYPLIILAGKEYGSGSSRDWAAKGASLLGVRAIIAESFERIHRSNLVGMGVLPLQFMAGENRFTLDLKGDESFDIPDLDNLSPNKVIRVYVTKPDGDKIGVQCHSQTRFIHRNCLLQQWRNTTICIKGFSEIQQKQLTLSAHIAYLWIEGNLSGKTIAGTAVLTIVPWIVEAKGSKAQNESWRLLFCWLVRQVSTG